MNNRWFLGDVLFFLEKINRSELFDCFSARSGISMYIEWTTTTERSNDITKSSSNETTISWIRLWNIEVRNRLFERNQTRNSFLELNLFMNNSSMKVSIESIRKIFENPIIVRGDSSFHCEKLLFFFVEILHDLHHLGYPFHHQHLWQELSGLICPSTIAE